MRVTLRLLLEDEPGALWRTRAEALLPGYLKWFAREGLRARPGYLECERALEEHMPELVPTWRTLVELLGGGDLVSRLLSLWRPTPFLAGCSQIAWPYGGGALIRNYDYAPWLWEGDFWNVAWSGARVQGMGDCLWGLLDGINEHGLCLSLAFGGRREVGTGFGMPLILRYALQTCSDTQQAAQVLQRVPSHMAYNVTVLDAHGAASTVEVLPGGGARVLDSRIAVNHQADSKWHEYAERTASRERERALSEVLAGPASTAMAVAARLLEPPFWSDRFEEGFGTLYTAVHEPLARTTTLVWHDAVERIDLERFLPGERTLQLGRAEPRPRLGARGSQPD